MGAMTEEIIFEADPFVETCNRLYSKWKVSHTLTLNLNAKPHNLHPTPYTLNSLWKSVTACFPSAR
jgi:hypothetical protein